MSYIIVWRNSHRDPHVSTNSHDFIEDFSTYEDAKEFAEANIDNEWYHDYQIYEEANS